MAYEINCDYAQNYPLLEKQYSALCVIAENSPISLDDVLLRLPYETTKQSFQFTLRALIQRGLVEKLPRQNIGGKSRRMLQITPIGLHKISTEQWITQKAADKKTCQFDEVAKTDRMIKEIEEKFL